MDDVIAERLPRHVRKRRTVVTADLERQQAARRLEMTLHARVELPLATQRGGIDDGTSRSVEIVARDRIDVLLPGTMTALAINTVGKGISKSRTFAILVDRRARISGVARHTPGIDRPAEVEVRG